MLLVALVTVTLGVELFAEPVTAVPTVPSLPSIQIAANRLPLGLKVTVTVWLPVAGLTTFQISRSAPFDPEASLVRETSVPAVTPTLHDATVDVFDAAYPNIRTRLQVASTTRVAVEVAEVVVFPTETANYALHPVIESKKIPNTLFGPTPLIWAFRLTQAC